MVWFPNSWFYLSRKKCIVAMFSCFKKSEKKKLLREVYLLARCLMLNWSRRHAFMYATKTRNLWVFFTVFRNFFVEIYIKIILQEKKMNWVWHRNNSPFAASNSRGTKPPGWRAKAALGQDKQKTYNFKWQFSLLGCVQTDATTPNNVGTCGALWEGYNP